MGALSITGKSMGSTSLVLQAGTVTKTIPVSVKSRNLLSYGPASDNGLTATVNSDGSLHITGTASKQWAGVAWTFPCPVQGNVTLRTPTSITGLSVNVKFLDAKGNLLGSQLVSGKSAAVPANTVSLRFEILSSEATPTLKNGDIRAQLESGDTAHDWMKPDNTSLRGGVPMFLSTPWGVDVSGFRLAVVGALRPAGGVRRPFPCGPVQATRAGSW